MWEIVAKGFKSCPKSNKLPNLVILVIMVIGVGPAFRTQSSTIFIYYKVPKTASALSLDSHHHPAIYWAK